MKLDCKIYIQDENGTKFFGRGPYELLKRTEEFGSLNAAAKEMGMAYSKAFRIVRDAENALGFPLLVRATGGKNGGGSRLTVRGKECVRRYAFLEERIKEFARSEFDAVFRTDYPDDRTL